MKCSKKQERINVDNRSLSFLNVFVITFFVFWVVVQFQGAAFCESSKTGSGTRFMNHAITAKIGYIDFDLIVKNSIEGRKSLEKMKAFHSKRQEEIYEKEKILKQMVDEFDQKKYTLSSESRSRKAFEIDQKKLELKRLVEDSEREIAKMEKSYLEPIQEKVFNIVRKFGKQYGYAIIFDKTRSTLVYTDPEYDLTDKIVKMYNEIHSNNQAGSKESR